ncbi:sigma 54-interacting transcriptional regulator [Thalassomonas actiniarum]|uniref:Sigma-54-dependent Fis family transcriptional regulator n=1 Tax=Thalassomonas actiniarum TaxID=485447 RepID=A0AAE9YH54_9GAMM|nr:sigma-54 dependent transcriptional regulator [Thalassomonas actiniarum]WDD96575.1 sigma-54-dependent Fis family transcriptional regulator [Thalassomonas actiniarum]
MFSIIDNNIIGQSASITQVKSLIKINAQYSAPVLITGETGTGKELAARGLHYSGIFADKPFIALNCSTFSDELFVSELFGYKKGAFTDAKTDKEGLLVAANGGSIFFDEIDSLSLKSQTALLRLLQESEFRPVGSSQVIKANVRIIAAANCDLCKKIASGEFRQDLYFRLFILSVRMPPLRERLDDLEVLIAYFINKFNDEYGLSRSGICERLFSKLKQYHWPGNIRELENTIHRYYLLAGGPVIDEAVTIDLDHNSLPPAASGQQIQQYPFADSGKSESGHLEVKAEVEPETGLDFCEAKRKAIEDFEASFVTKLLHQTKGNVTKAANMCGKERRAFGKLVKKYQINRQGLQLD